MRITLPGNNEIKVRFVYPKSKNGHTKCVVLYGTTDTLDKEKTVAAIVSVRRDSRDVDDRSAARTNVLNRALVFAENNGTLTAEQVDYIWNNVPMRIKWHGQRRNNKKKNTDD